MKLYLGLAKPLLLYIYLPLALIGLLVLFFKTKRLQTRLWAVPLYLFLAYVIPLGDVTWHSWHMAKVCPNAGIHIYRTVVVDGYMNGSEGCVKYLGYRFAESVDKNGDGFVTRWEKSVSGVQRLDGVPLISEWEVVSGYPKPDSELGVNVTHEYVRNRQTNEIIAERWSFSAWRGWIDTWIGSVIDNSPGGCTGGARILDASIEKILIPSE